MFKLTLSDKFRQKGISLDAISSEVYNCFVALIENLDCRIHVRLDENAVRFFYYMGNPDHDVLVEEKYKKIASISLNDKKETGNDILHFNKQVEESYEEITRYLKRTSEGKRVYDELVDYCDHLDITNVGGRFSPFPFVNLFKNTGSSFTESCEGFVFLMQCCFLYFILDIEDNESVFAQSPHYKEVCEKLHDSMVYKLLYAKLIYSICLYEDASPQNKDRYTKVTQHFADLLMDPNINKVISPYNFPEQGTDETAAIQMWFYNPEEELETILNKERKYQDIDGQSSLDSRIVLKISDFLYTKHDVEDALTKTISKRFFRCAQILMGGVSIPIIVSSIWKESIEFCLHGLFPVFVLLFSVFTICYYCCHTSLHCNQKNKYDYKYLYIYCPLTLLILNSLICLLSPDCDFVRYLLFTLVFVCVVVWTGLSGCFNANEENKRINNIICAFFPRILVAVFAAWLVVGVSEDLTKGLLSVDNPFMVFVTLVIVVFIITIILLGKIKQHSPYLNRKVVLKRILIILNHSFFYAIVIGIVAHFSFCDNLIRNSNVFASSVYCDYFGKVNNYCHQLENLDKVVVQYENLRFIDTASLKKIKSKTVEFDDNVYSSVHANAMNSFTNLEEYIEIHNKLVEKYDVIRSRLNTYYNTPEFLHAEMQKVKIDTIDSISPIEKIGRIRDENINKILPLRIDIRNEISIVQSAMMSYNNYETLTNWASFNNSERTINTGSECIDMITKEAIEQHNMCYEINLFNGKKYRFFPSVFILQTLIVLVLAFVTQLFISEKSVTEPL